MTSAAPLDAAEAAALFAPLLPHGHVLLAVSGGADSTALLWLAARWRRQGADCRLSVATIDHGLRPEAAGECAAVAALATRLGLDCSILKREGPAWRTRLQEQARTARYSLLTEAARTAGASAIATAHTLDDQAETVLMRLAHGSSVDGLAAMRPVGALDGGFALLRPLLGVPKSRLVATLQAEGLGWSEDPSNADPRFERVRLRRAMADLAEIGLSAPVLVALARRAGRAAEALEAQAQALFEALHRREGETLTLERETFLAAPMELRLRVLAKALAAVAPATGGRYPLRLERIEALVEALIEKNAPLRRTLGGAVVNLPARGPLALAREGPRQRGFSPMQKA